MEFCKNCKNYLFLKECKVNGDRKLIYYCKQCDFSKDCIDNKISFKIYKKTDNLENDSYLNKFKVTDLTLPRKTTKCPKCKKTNNNVYEVKYFNNSYNLNIICKHCHHNFSL